MRKNLFLLLICLLAISLPAFSQTQDPKTPPKEPAKEQPKDSGVAGDWAMVVQSPQGERPTDMTITQDKETIKVSLNGPDGSPIAGQGTCKDGAIQWVSVISTPNGDFTLGFKGKVEGDKITGEVQMGDFGTATFSATKKKK